MLFRAPSHTALLPRLWSPEGSRTLQEVVLVLAGTLLIAIAAKIKVPFYPVPMTLQTLAIMLIAATFGARLGVITVLAYIGQGLVGLPVFTNTPPAVAGPAYMLGPTAGFIMSWVLVAALIGTAADRGWDRSIPRLASVMLVAVALQFGIGFAWLAWLAQLPSGVMGIGAAAAFAGGVAPFILGDLLKIAIAAIGVPAAWQLIGERG